MTSTLPMPLIVSAEWLAHHMAEPDLNILDASSYLPTEGRDTHAEYLEEHIPGTVFFDIDAVVDKSAALPHTLPTPGEFAEAVEFMGISPHHRVVIYDTSPFFSAPRVWWMFRYFGHEDVAVLDGGLPAWKKAGLPVETGPVTATRGMFEAIPQLEMLADLDAVLAAVKSGNTQIADARGHARFTGEEPEFRPGIRSGHMPGAKNVPYASLIGDDGLFKEPDEIADVFKKAGIDVDQPVITTCGSGVTAGVLAFGLARLGKSARLYDGSWTEWGGRDDTPVATGE